MVSSNTSFRTPVPTAPRLSVDLPCTLDTGAESIEATACNLSYSGIALRVPADLPLLRRDTAMIAELAELGRIGVQVRWQRGGQIGMSFTQKRSLRPRLDAYFRSIGQYPD